MMHAMSLQSKSVMAKSEPVVRRAEPSEQTLQPMRWSSQVLLAGRNEIEIEHNNAIYRLRLTSLGKLILTK